MEIKYAIRSDERYWELYWDDHGNMMKDMGSGDASWPATKNLSHRKLIQDIVLENSDLKKRLEQNESILNHIINALKENKVPEGILFDETNKKLVLQHRVFLPLKPCFRACILYLINRHLKIFLRIYYFSGASWAVFLEHAYLQK